MNQSPAYEQIIGDKLLNFPVPDMPGMQDMIWARVKAQLDIDLPTNDDDGDDEGPQPPSGGGMLRRGLAILLVAFVSAFLIFKNKKPATPLTVQPTVNTSPLSQPSNPANSPPLQQKDGRKQVAPLPAINYPPAAGNPLLTDTIISGDVGVATTAAPDSLQKDLLNAAVQGQSPPPLLNTDTPLVKKKRRGVTGIKDDDYRIVPKKKD